MSAKQDCCFKFELKDFSPPKIIKDPLSRLIECPNRGWGRDSRPEEGETLVQRSSFSKEKVNQWDDITTSEFDTLPRSRDSIELKMEEPKPPNRYALFFSTINVAPSLAQGFQLF